MESLLVLVSLDACDMTGLTSAKSWRWHDDDQDVSCEMRISVNKRREKDPVIFLQTLYILLGEYRHLAN